MKKSLKNILLLVLLVFVASFGFAQADAADDSEQIYTFVVEDVCKEPALNRGSVKDRAAVFSAGAYSGRYGNQLDGLSREFYDSMVKYYVTDKNINEYTHTYKTPFTFEAEIIMGTILNTSELSDIKYEIRCAMQMAQDALLYDYPQLFWLRVFGTSYSISTKGNSADGYIGSINSIIITPYETYLGSSEKISAYNAAVDKALSSIVKSDIRYETLKNVHDYICDKAWYNYSSDRSVYTSEPIFIGNGGVVCEGYSESFKILCDRLGIPCAIIVGDASEPHMWNYVQMEDGKWYLVDVTWNDSEDSEISYTYFIANANTIGFDDVPIRYERTESGDFSETGIMSFVYPKLSESEYSVHIHRWNSTYTVDKAPTCTVKGSKSIHCSGCTSKKSVTEMPATNHAGRMNFAKQEATCTKKGYTAGVYCSDCKKWLSGHEEIGVKAHSYNKTTAAATLKADGKITQKCIVCNSAKTTVISRPAKFSLSKTAYTYDGKEKNPTVTVKDGNGKVLKNGTDYKVTYEKGRKNPGEYSVRIDFTGKYSGTKRLYFTVAPAVPVLAKTAQSVDAIRLTWNKVPGADGYRVYKYNSKTDTWDKICTVQDKTYRIEKLKAGTKYKFKIKAYKKDGDTIWGKATSAITVATKPAVPELTKTSQSVDAIRFTWEKVTGADGYGIYQYNSESKKWDSIKTVKGTTCRIENLKSGVTYKFKLKAYKMDGDVTLWSSATSTITVATKPAAPKITKLTTTKKKADVSWANVTGESGYELQYSSKKSSGFKKVATYKADITKGSKSKLTRDKTYYFRVRAYTTVGDTKIYSAWSAVKSLKIK